MRFLAEAVLTASVFAGVALTFLTPIVSAHSLGASFEATTTPYRVDVGYDPAEFMAGYASRFDFDLREESGPVTEYDYVWVRITKEKQTLFATGIERQLLGPTTLLYTFDIPGNYTLHVSYRQGTDVMAEASFAFTVVANDSGPMLPRDGLMGFGVGAAFSIAGISTWLRLRRSHVRDVS